MSPISGCFGQTHSGKQRGENEDRFVIDMWADQNAALAVIADGMGSYGGGAVAASTVVDTFAELLHESLPESRAERYEMLLSAFYRADARIRNLQGLGTSEMGATVVACVATENEVLHLHAGDCRIFHFSGDRLAYVSHDHSVVQALVDSGIIDEQDAVAHPMRNAVTSCVGGPSSNLRLTIDPQYDADDSDGIQGDSAFRALSNGDVIVMCSDGLWSEVGRDKMWAAVKRTRLTGCVATELSAALLQLALAGPATDNITAIVIDTDRLREGLSQRRREKSSLRAASRVTGVLAERNMDNP